MFAFRGLQRSGRDGVTVILAAVARDEGAGWSPECAWWILEVSLQVSGNLDKQGLPTRLQDPKGWALWGP